MKAQKSEKSVWVFRLVVVSLGLCMLASLIGAIILAAQGTDTPEILVALGSAVVGGLAGTIPLNR
jgi:hypothetical protein